MLNKNEKIHGVSCWKLLSIKVSQLWILKSLYVINYASVILNVTLKLYIVRYRQEKIILLLLEQSDWIIRL